MTEFLAVIFVGFIFILKLGPVSDILSGVAGKETNKFIGPYFLLSRLKRPYKSAIEDNMPYYANLDDKDKIRFEKRVQRFIDLKEFIPRGELEHVTPEMKALISGTAIKLTFGFPYVYLTHFWKVLLYDGNYYSNITRKYHKGEVNAKGHIILSWDNFLHGHENRDDGVNLGLHEMAHALRLENAIINREYNFLDFNALYGFTIMAKKEIERMKMGKESMFRRYAMTNEHEFFSVFVENFFERPELLSQEHPKKYEAMCRMLLQDPLQGNRIRPSFK